MNYTGALPSQIIRQLIAENIIKNSDNANIQPSSLDLTITNEIYKMKGVFLPRQGEKIREIIADGALYRTSLDNPLECGGVYLIKLQEELNLPEQIYAYANNKSSSGRLNLQVRLLTDGVQYFDKISRGASGELWVVVSPKSFSIKLHAGNTLNQIRFFGSNTRLTEDEYLNLYQQHYLLTRQNQPIHHGEIDFKHDITMTIDLDRDLIGYKCSPSPSKVIDFNQRGHYDPADFFEPIYRTKNNQLILRSNEFYILSTVEDIRIPKDYATEMVAYDPSKGEFRSHYAGFFDPGFGFGDNGEINGATAVLEILTQDNDFILRHGQPICKMVYEKLTETPDIIYGGQGLGSNYQGQKGPKLSKHFKI